MKTFRLIGMASVAVLMVASCNKDDNPAKGEEGVAVNEKKLTKLVASSNGESITYTFNYDDNGKLAKTAELSKYQDNTYTFLCQYIWADNAIKASANSDSYIFALENGLVKSVTYSYEMDSYTMEYNQSNRFAKHEIAHGGIITALWDNDKLVSIYDNDYSVNDITLNYGTSCKNGYSPLTAIIAGFLDEPLFIAHPEIGGLRTNQLPTNLTCVNTDGADGKTTTEALAFSYEFDNEGYISKITETGEEETWTYTLTWGKETPIESTLNPNPEEMESEITIDDDIIQNGLTFSCAEGEKSISFTTNEDWTLSISSNDWCTAFPKSGNKGQAVVNFYFINNALNEERSVSVTIKSGTATQSFTITQKGEETEG